ncbi:alanine--glyoxylate aminotransferase family protein [Clostridiales bacterium COT073_COT-073]|nr:alanine--glyoxylate aminotransferase family protein [Clostridiales bacterium COT073_COT-073]
MLILSAGPTTIAPNTLAAMSQQKWNADLSKPFYEQYQRVVAKYDELIQNTSGFSFIMGAEAMIALEGACASLIEPKDKILVLANGIFGRGFAELITMYQGEPVMVYQPDDRGFSLEAVKTAVAEHPDVKIAVMIHCETPTGVTNEVTEICRFLKKCGILSVVDSVSAIGGEALNYDDSGIDVLLGGSQKCLSAPAGLGFVTLSREAVAVIQNRNTPIASYYANYQYFLHWQEKMWFPYTMPEQLINAMETALDNILAIDSLTIHARFAKIIREVLTENGLKLFAKSQAANTLTAFYVPEKITAPDILKHLQDKYQIIVSGSLAEYQTTLLRIGHMGENNKEQYFEQLFAAMDGTWKDLGLGESHFLKSYQERI